MSFNGHEVAKLAGWFAGGALIGVGAGLLLAPQTGSDSRRTVVRYAKRAQVQAIRVGRALKTGAQEVGKTLADKHEAQKIGEAA
ncbi:MAG: YtxH domain-containing protein [Nitrospiraceae bacterium]